MPNKEKFRVSFDEPDEGWIGIELTEKERHCSLQFGHLPHDTIHQLTEGLGDLLSVSTEIVALANDGPIEYEFVFTKDGDQYDFRCFLLNETPSGKAFEEIFSATGSVDEIVAPFWRALRNLETKYRNDEYHRRWGEPFPKNEMRYFTDQIEKLKN